MWDEPVIEPTKLITLDVIVVLEPSTVNVPSISVLSKVVVPSTSKSPSKSHYRLKSMRACTSTAPSISTTSRFVVPSTSKSPLKSTLPSVRKVPVTVTFPLD